MRADRELLTGRRYGLAIYAARLRPCLFLLASYLLSATPGAADDAQQVWLLSTRCIDGCCDELAAKEIRYRQLDENCDWQAANACDFRASDDVASPTVVFIHGNNTAAAQAISKGLFVYESIRSEVCDRRFRFVIWSWPADRLCLTRNRVNSRLNAAQCDLESYYLAAWLSEFRPGVKICLTGHSFGPRIITGALQLLAGGQLDCRTLPEETVAAWAGGKRNPVRAVLMAAAMDTDWLAPGCRHGQALSLSDQVLITTNGCDRVLRWYPRLWYRHGPQAMGFVGPCGVGCNENVEAIDVSETVGKFHDWRGYARAPEVRCRWAHYAFLDDELPETNAAESRAAAPQHVTER